MLCIRVCMIGFYVPEKFLCRKSRRDHKKSDVLSDLYSARIAECITAISAKDRMNYKEIAVKIHKNSLWFVLLMGGMFLLLLAACNPTTPPTFTPTAEPTATMTSTPTSTPSPTPSPTPTPDPATFIEEAEAKFWQSDLEEAAALYQQALTVQPDYVPAYIGLSLLEISRSVMDFEQSLHYAQKAVDADPESAAAHTTLAYVYAAQKKGAEALEEAQKAVALDPQNAYGQAILARAYLLDRRYAEAKEAAETAYTLDPASVYAAYALASVYEDMADFPRARAVYEHVVALKPDFFDVYQDIGWHWLNRERYDLAEAAFEKALELAPHNQETLLALARLSAEKRDYETANSWLDKAAALNLEEAPVYLERGYLFRQQNKYDEALEQFNRAAKLMPEAYAARLAIGYAYFGKEECSRAEREFQSAAEAQPRFAGPQIGIGFAKFCSGDAAKALTYFRKAIQLEPYNAWAHQGMGDAYALQERWEESAKAYVEAIRLSPAPASLHAALAAWYLEQEKTEEAEAEFQLAADLNPYLPSPLIGLARIWSDQQEARALTTIQKAAALDGSNQEARYLLGLLKVLQNDSSSGATLLESVLDKDPEKAHAHYFLGIAYTQMGRYREAKKELETFQTLANVQQNYQLQNFITALDKGFKLSEDKAIEQMLELFDQFTKVKPKIVIAGTSGATRVMTMTIPLSATDLSAENTTALYSKIGITAAIVGLRVPQIDPPVEGGVLMQYERNGKVQFTVRVTFENLQRFFYGWLGGQQFAAKLEFSQMLTSGAKTSLKQVERQIAEIRELDLKKSVPSETMTKEELREDISTSIDREASTALENDKTMFELLGLIEPSLDLQELLVDVRTEQTAGFYRLDEDKFYIVETQQQSAADQTTIAHEYVHALQDQHFDLTALGDDESDGDRRLAFRALMEGDATLATILYAEEHVPVIDLLHLISSAGGIESEAMESSPMFIQQILTFPYSQGLAFVKALYDRDKWDEVNAAYASPPQSTEQILHPERYWDGDVPTPVSLGDLVTQLDGAWTELDSDVLGELGLRLTLAAHAGPVLAAQAAEGWDGDRYALLQAGETHVLVVSTIWDNEKEATEFFNLYRATLAHRRDFIQDVPSLVGEISAYRWLADNRCAYAAQEGERVTLLMSTTCAALDQVLAVLP